MIFWSSSNSNCERLKEIKKRLFWGLGSMVVSHEIEASTIALKETTIFEIRATI